MIQPYIGVTGFMSCDEVSRCLGAIPDGPEMYKPGARKLMIGVLASGKTISGQRNNLWRQFPPPSKIARIFSPDKRAFNLIHFATSEPEKLYDHLMLSTEYGGDWLNGFQLNMVWPDEKLLERVKNQRPDLQFILQISPHLAGYAAYTPPFLASELSRYRGLIDSVIIDYGRGFGLAIPSGEAWRYLSAVSQFQPQINLVVGGGLYYNNIKTLIGPLLVDFPDLSWDAQGQLRDDADGGGNLVLDEAVAYLKKSFEILQFKIA